MGRPGARLLDGSSLGRGSIILRSPFPIVPSNHSAPRHPQAIAKVARILKLNLLWLGGAIILPILWRKRRRGFLIVIVGFAAILAWWLTIQPRNDRDWKPEVAVLAHADIDGNRVTIHDIRNFEYRTETDFTPHYNTRSYDLDQLKGIDLFVNYWGSDLIAHPIISFDFGNNNHIAFSIETRPEKGEGYSTMGGLYRRFELIYIPGDERDLVRVRTNFRKGEDVYLFKINSAKSTLRKTPVVQCADDELHHQHPITAHRLRSGAMGLANPRKRQG